MEDREKRGRERDERRERREEREGEREEREREGERERVGVCSAVCGYTIYILDFASNPTSNPPQRTS